MKAQRKTIRQGGFAVLLFSFALSFATFADPGGVADQDAGTYTLDKDSAYTVTSEDVSAAEGLAIVKKGSGTVTAAMRSAYRRCAVAEAGEGTLELDLLPIPGLKFIIR